jgi:hypothetical protein
MLVHIFLLTLTAVVPALFAIFFWISLGLNAPGGQFNHNNGTYVRPSSNETFLGIKVKSTAPLLISSLSSSTMYVHPIIRTWSLY